MDKKIIVLLSGCILAVFLLAAVAADGYEGIEAEKGGMQMLENQTGRNMKVMEGQNIRNGIRMMA